jgi:hypothetical protein
MATRKNRMNRKSRKNNTMMSGGKRKMNPFMKFAKQERPKIMASMPGAAIPAIGKELGKRWRALSESEKTRFRH